MVTNVHNVALVIAGVIGSGVAIVHGVLTQRLMIRLFDRRAEGQFSVSIRRLVAILLQFSTFNWFLGGIALIIAAAGLDYEARLVTGLLVGSSYLYGALGNLWGTRRWHPGWMLYVVALLLIVYGLSAPNG
jgi:hypothetical protein